VCQGYSNRLRELFIRTGYQTSEVEWTARQSAAAAAAAAPSEAETSRQESPMDFDTLHECRTVCHCSLLTSIVTTKTSLCETLSASASGGASGNHNGSSSNMARVDTDIKLQVQTVQLNSRFFEGD